MNLEWEKASLTVTSNVKLCTVDGMKTYLNIIHLAGTSVIYGWKGEYQ